MLWQDYVFSGATIAFSYALIPQIIKGFREKKANITTQTATITSGGLIICAATASTMDLYLTTALYSVASGLWGTLFYQSIKYKNNSLEDKLN
ncbi:hypothetical protein J4406_01215 [Candidatus Woesearchaeota archaeon]|nr:hypothetical protein [Candidatus Woesearchaeota archaeon]